MKHQIILLRSLKYFVKSIIVVISFILIANVLALAKFPGSEVSISDWHSERFPSSSLLFSLVDKAKWVLIVWLNPVGAQYVEIHFKAREFVRSALDE